MVQFGLNQQEVQDGYNNAAMNPYDAARDSGPGFFEGIPQAVGTGFERGELEIMNLFAPNDADVIHDAMDMARPLPQTTGWLGQALYGLTSSLPAYIGGTAASGGNPLGGAALLAASKGYAETGDLEKQGVDSTTATELGGVEGLTQGVGAVLPVGLGGSRLVRLASGAAMNAGLNAANRGATSTILAEHGYKDMAEQYKAFDAKSIFADAILGMLFSAAHSGHREPLPSDVDAALAANNVHNFELDTAPGIPADLATRNSHVDAMDTATQQLLQGEPVNIGESFTDSNFIAKRDDTEARARLDEAVKENGLDQLEMPAARSVSDEAGGASMMSPTGTFEGSQEEPFHSTDSSPPEGADANASIAPSSLRGSSEGSSAPAIAEPYQTEVNTASSSRIAKTTVYAKVPKAPPRLAEFVRKSGGLTDEGGDVRHVLGGAKYRPGLISKKGLSADDLALKAWENGYFPEHAERPTANEFIDKLNDDLTGKAQYSDHHRDDLAAHQEAQAYNADADRLASDLGIDTTGKSRKEFWDAVAEHMSVEEQAELEELSAAHEAALEEADRKAREWLESRGDAWESEEEQYQTLEDLEREREQENTANGEAPIARRLGPSGSASGDRGPVQDSGGQGRSGAEPAGRTDAQGAGRDFPVELRKAADVETRPEAEYLDGYERATSNRPYTVINRKGYVFGGFDTLDEADEASDVLDLTDVRIVHNPEGSLAADLPKHYWKLTDGQRRELLDYEHDLQTYAHKQGYTADEMRAMLTRDPSEHATLVEPILSLTGPTKPPELESQRRTPDASERRRSPGETIAAEKPNLQVATEDGTMTAPEALANADADIDRAKKESGLFDVAINCFLRFGDEG